MDAEIAAFAQEFHHYDDEDTEALMHGVRYESNMIGLATVANLERGLARALFLRSLHVPKAEATSI